MPERESYHPSPNHSDGTRELLRKVAVTNQLAYRSLLGFYVDFCRSPFRSQYGTLEDAPFITNGIAPKSHDLIVMRQRGAGYNDQAASLNNRYLLASHSIESGITTHYDVTGQTVIDHGNKDLFNHVGDSLAVQFEATSIPSQLSPVQRKISLLATNRHSIWLNESHPAGQSLHDIGNLPYEIAYDLSSPRSVHYLDEQTRQELTLLPRH